MKKCIILWEKYKYIFEWNRLIIKHYFVKYQVDSYIEKFVLLYKKSDPKTCFFYFICIFIRELYVFPWFFGEAFLFLCNRTIKCIYYKKISLGG